jgi:hypothetical protein
VYRRGLANVELSAVTNPAHIADLRSKIDRLAGAERGIFGLDKLLRADIHASIEATEALNPTAEPTLDDARIANGSWRLLYTTLTILGRRRVRLAIATKSRPGFVRLGELYQCVDAAKRETQNIVVFDLAIGGSGTFTVTADYGVVSPTRVEVQTKDAALEPKKLEDLLGPNIDLLSEIFDPTGYLDITYIDDHLRIGRDDKGNIFVLERCKPVDIDALGSA